LGNVLAELKIAIDLKKAHLDIDTSCRSGAVSPGPGGAAGSSPSSRSKILPHRWKAQAQELVAKAMQTVETSHRVRNKSKTSQSDIATRQQSMKDLCVTKLLEKLNATEGLASDLDSRISKVDAEIAAVDNSLNETQTSIAAKAEPMGLAGARLSTRMDRPAAERVRDEVEVALEVEIADITASLKRLSTDVSTMEVGRSGN
jgi:chromosome segregation ATPase